MGTFLIERINALIRSIRNVPKKSPRRAGASVAWAEAGEVYSGSTQTLVDMVAVEVVPAKPSVQR